MMRVRFDEVLVWVMGLLAVVYLGALVWPGRVPHTLVDLWLSLLVSWLPAAVCWLAVRRAGNGRREVLSAALAMTALAVADTYYAPWTSDWEPPFPNPGDFGYLVFYLLMLATLGILVRRDMRGQTRSVWLDCAVGSLGAASVLAVALNPVIRSAMVESWSLATAVAVAYPLMDVLLIAAITGMVVVRGLRRRDGIVLLLGGLLIYSVADVVYALQVTRDIYVVGTPLDPVWGIGITLIALYVHDSARPAPTETQAQPLRPHGAAALIVSGSSTLAGLGVLVLGTRTPLSSLAVVLAAATVVAAAARANVAYRQLVRMADLRRQATTDYLTGLPNRRALYSQGRARLLDPARRRQALLLMDLDRFKEVNDSLGHHAGDKLLIQVGARLGGQLRAEDLLVRLGGDEFALLLNDAGPEKAAAVAAKLCAALAEPFVVEDITVHSAVSIGFALYPTDADDLDALLRRADVAMYKAKASGDGYHAYGASDDTDFSTRLRTVAELRVALKNDQLILHYQPKIDLPSGDVHDVEALVRWNHPTRGLLYPDAFVTLVEEAGLMPAMTREVLHLALDQAAVWGAAGRNLTVAVNLSASSMIDSNLPDEVAAMLTSRNLAPTALKLEITEEFLMADRDRARGILTRLSRHGVQISIDDFGTGYSSLSYLRDLPIDELKLDRSFVLPMTGDPRAGALVASVVGLARGLGLRLVAEGVENVDAYDELIRLGCDQAQGFYISKPVPAADLNSWLSARGTADELVGLERDQRAPQINALDAV